MSLESAMNKYKYPNFMITTGVWFLVPNAFTTWLANVTFVMLFYFWIVNYLDKKAGLK